MISFCRFSSQCGCVAILGYLLLAPTQLKAEAAGIEPTTVLESTPAGALAFSPDSNWLAIGGEYKGPLKLWKVGGTAEPRVVEDVKAMYQSVMFSPDGKLLTASRVSLDPAASIVSVWTADGKSRLMEYKLGAYWSAFTPDNKGVAIGKFRMVYFLDPKSGQQLSGFEAHKEADTSAGAFAANGKLFATAGGEAKQLRLWDPKSGKLLRTVPIAGECRTISVSPDARLIAYAFEKTIAVVDAETGRERWLSNDHQDNIMKVCFSPDGKEVATACHDRTVRRWNAADGKVIAVLEPDRGTVQTVAYSPDGKWISVGTSGVVLLYSLNGTGANKTAPTKTSPVQTTSGSRKTSETSGSGQSLRFKARQVDWKTGEERKPLIQPKQGIAYITGLAGNFGGKDDSFEIQVGKNGAWTLGGKSGDFIAARAAAVTELQPIEFSPKVTRFEWSNGKPPVKMLHRKDGICVLAGVAGPLRGFGEEVKVRLGDDGYWYLDGKTAQRDLRAIALGIKWNKPGVWMFSETTRSWKTGEEPVNMGKRSDGLCYLSGISGNMLGGGEGVEIIEQDDDWILRGAAQQETQFEAMLIQFEKVKK